MDTWRRHRDVIGLNKVLYCPFGFGIGCGDLDRRRLRQTQICILESSIFEGPKLWRCVLERKQCSQLVDVLMSRVVLRKAKYEEVLKFGVVKEGIEIQAVRIVKALGNWEWMIPPSKTLALHRDDTFDSSP